MADTHKKNNQGPGRMQRLVKSRNGSDRMQKWVESEKWGGWNGEVEVLMGKFQTMILR
jgi:hypothetical protein